MPPFPAGETPGVTSRRLTLSFEPQTAFLRHLRLGDHEVVRAIDAAIRDQAWAQTPNNRSAL
jgi:hypothetical protein